MKNREFKTLIATVILMAMVAGSVGTTPAYVYAAESRTPIMQSTEQERETDISDPAAGAKPFKDETVYAKVDGNGNVKSVTVSDQLKNISGESEVKDISDLKDIVNVKGDETFSETGNGLVWDVDDADICYQGTTDKELPVGITVTYKLDGKEISAEELEGKSGHLIIRYTYENQTGSAKESRTPFLMATGLIMDGNKYTNISVSNGKLISDGDRDIAIGFGLPAMNDMLGTEELDIPDYFEVEADVTEYEAVQGITIATNSIFNELDTSQMDSLDDLKSSMNELQDAADQLVSGSGQLKDGLDTLLASSGTLKDGVEQLGTGSKDLKNGTGELAVGAEALAAGSQELASGTARLTAGAKQAQEGAAVLSGGLDTASAKVNEVLLPGAKQLDAGVAAMQESLEEQLPGLSNGVAALDSGIAQAADGAAALDAGVDSARAQVETLNAGVDQAAAGAAALNQGIDTLSGNLTMLQSTAADVSTEAASLAGSVQSEAASRSAAIDASIAALQNLAESMEDEEQKAAVLAVIAELDDARTNLSDVSGQTAKLSAEAQGVADGIQAANGMLQTADGQTTLKDAAAALDGTLHQGNGTSATIKDGVTAVQSALTYTGTGETLKDGTAALNAALNTGNPEAGMSSIRQGAQDLNAAVNDPQRGLTAQVNAGVSQLRDGTSSLVSGVDGKEGLAFGLNQLSGGAKELASGNTALANGLASADAGAKSVSAGAGELSAGADQLNAGAGTLADGIGTLQTGSAALIDGVKQLDEGAVKLNDGMIQFNENGIEKLVDVFDGDIDGLLDTVNEMLEASKSYKNFSGIASDMDGEVKFLFIMDE